MATIYKRNNIWWGSYCVNGKRKQQSLRTASERVAVEWRKTINAMDQVRLLNQPSRTPLLAFLESYARHLIASQTAVGGYNDLSRLRCFFGPCTDALHYRPRGRHDPDAPNGTLMISASKLEDVTPLMIATWLSEQVGEGRFGAATANDYREILQRLFNHAGKLHGYVCPDSRYRNPVEGVPRFNEAAPVITFLKLSEIPQQLKALNGRPVVHALVATLIFAGLRRAEALWLTREDLDLKRRLIQVRAKRVEGRSWQPKTKRNRAVPLGRQLTELLQTYIDTQRPLQWLFPAPDGGWWHPDNFSQDLAAMNKAAGLPWSCLDYRHTFGSQLAQRGVSLFKISAMMGNSPEICRRHYAALVPEMMHDDVEFSTENQF